MPSSIEGKRVNSISFRSVPQHWNITFSWLLREQFSFSCFLLILSFRSRMAFFGAALPCAQPKIWVFRSSAFVLFMGFRCGQMHIVYAWNLLFRYSFRQAIIMFSNPQREFPCRRRAPHARHMSFVAKSSVHIHGSISTAYRHRLQWKMMPMLHIRLRVHPLPYGWRRSQCHWVSFIRTLLSSRQAIVVCNLVFFSFVSLHVCARLRPTTASLFIYFVRV